MPFSITYHKNFHLILPVKGQQLHDSLNWEEDHVVQRKLRETEKKEEGPWPLGKQLSFGRSVTEKTQM